MEHETDLLRRVRRIEIKAKKLSQQIFAGQYHSAFRGHGMAFSEVRGYQVGDDTRDIDWNVTARYASPFVKVFEEERELTIMLLIDITGSTLYGSRYSSKRDRMCELAATLAFSAIQNQDRVGAILFSDGVELYIPARSGRHHILYIIRELLTFSPHSQRTDLTAPLGYLMSTSKKRCTAFLISDMMQDTEQYQTALTLVGRKHELIALRTYDPTETELPQLGLVQMEDAEAKHKRWVDTSSVLVRKQYAERYSKWVTSMTAAFNRSGIDIIHLSTEQDYAPELIKLFKNRR